jgi:hypothetical protein
MLKARVNDRASPLAGRRHSGWLRLLASAEDRPDAHTHQLHAYTRRKSPD